MSALDLRWHTAPTTARQALGLDLAFLGNSLENSAERRLGLGVGLILPEA